MRKEDRRSDSLGCQLGWDLSQAWPREMGRGTPRSPQVLLHFLSALFFVSYRIKLLINSLMWSLIQQMLVRCFEAETVHQPHRLCPLYLEGSGLRWGSWLGHRVQGGGYSHHHEETAQPWQASLTATRHQVAVNVGKLLF